MRLLPSILSTFTLIQVRYRSVYLWVKKKDINTDVLIRNGIYTYRSDYGWCHFNVIIGLIKCEILNFETKIHEFWWNQDDKRYFKGGFGIEWNKKTYRDVIQSISKREEANWEWQFLETDIGYYIGYIIEII